MLTIMKTRTLIVAVVLSVLSLSACAGTPVSEPTPTVTHGRGPIATDRTAIPAPTPTPEPYSFALECRGEDMKTIGFRDFRAVWDSPEPMRGCNAGLRTGTLLSPEQAAALTTAYGQEKVESLGILYSICGSLEASVYSQMPSYSPAQAAEIRGALALCPDQPAAAATQAKLDASVVIDTQRTDGVRFGGGIHPVNTEIQPGTYVSEGNLENCYWEKLDASGNIIDNNFVTNALRVEVYIDASDFSFSSSGCGEWVLQG